MLKPKHLPDIDYSNLMKQFGIMINTKDLKPTDITGPLEPLNPLKMHLHQHEIFRTNAQEWEIFRVPTGWIYSIITDGKQGSHFIPFPVSKNED